MLEMIKAHLDTTGVFTQPLLPQIDILSKCVTNLAHPDMLNGIAKSELMLLASHFRRYMPDPKPGSEGFIPVNNLSMILAGSGEAKDSSVREMRAVLKPAYELIDKKRKSIAKTKAIHRAQEAGDSSPEEWDTYKSYYRKPAPIFTRLTNDAAYMEHLADTEANPVGAGFLMSSEIGSEMETNAHLIPIIRVLSELYDAGSAPVQILRDKTKQTPEIKQLPVSALFIGSQENILFDEKIKKLFKKEFGTKLARRTDFIFAPYGLPKPTADNMTERRKMRKNMADAAVAHQTGMKDQATKIAEYNLSRQGQHLTIDEDALLLYEDYLDYNHELSDSYSTRYPLSKLSRKHMSWKAYKMSGMCAMVDCSDVVTLTHMKQAIAYTESLSEHLKNFEIELVKENYEVFSDYLQSELDNGKSSIGLHALRKLEYITGTGNPSTKMKDLITNAAAYDKEGIYTMKDDEIHYEKVVKTDVNGASFLHLEGIPKDQRNHVCASGYTYAEVLFKDLAGLLSNDVAYSPFRFKEGKRSNDNIDSSTKWMVFDIDESPLKYTEMHFMLDHINHHISCTSNPDNHYKFRLIVELDAPVDLDPQTWRYFVEAVGNYLAIKPDLVPKSQPFYGYADREVLSVLDKEPIAIRDHVMSATNRTTEKVTAQKDYTPKEKAVMIEDKFNTFETLFNSSEGDRHRNFMAAIQKGILLGMDDESILGLIDEANIYIDMPLSPKRLNVVKSALPRYRVKHA